MNKRTLILFIVFLSTSISLLNGQTAIAQKDSTQRKSEKFIICNNLDETASYPGGAAAWVKYLRKRLKPLAPPCESGKIFLSFKVLKTGQLDSIRVRKGLCEFANQNAIELVKNSGLWHPECLKGKPIDSIIGISLNLHYK